jgi:hypothetical protein
MDHMKEFVEKMREPLKEIPMFSIGMVPPSKTHIPATYSAFPDSHPTIGVKKIENIDTYLIAHDNFLARWVPGLEFNYTAPQKLSGHVSDIQKFIKLAFYDQYRTVRDAFLEIKNVIVADLTSELVSGKYLPETVLSRLVSDKDLPETVLSRLVSGKDLSQLKDVEQSICEKYPAYKLLSENLVIPAVFNEHVDAVFATLRPKEILDISGHKGSGYFLLWNDPETEEMYALPTIGSFGHFLPEPGFSIIKEMGWYYFREVEIIGFQIGHLRNVLIENNDGVWEDWKLKGPVYLEVSESEYDDNSVSRIQIDGVFFQGTIYSSIE